MLYIPTIKLLNKLVIDPYIFSIKDKDIITEKDIDLVLCDYMREVMPTFIDGSAIEPEIKESLLNQIKGGKEILELDYDNYSISKLKLNDDMADGESNIKNTLFLFKCIRWCFLCNSNHECYVTRMPGVEEFKLIFSYHNRITDDALYIDWLPQEPNRLYVSIISKDKEDYQRTKLLIKPTIYAIYNLLYNISHIHYGDKHSRMSADVYLKGSPIELLYKQFSRMSADVYLKGDPIELLYKQLYSDVDLTKSKDE